MKIHFIGIGGIGVSALAQYYLAKGHEVSGSDLSSSEITDYLEKRGAKISKPKLPDLVIYSPAVKGDNPELKCFKEKGIKCLSYPEALGELTKQYFTIAVSGTHGKSTTTAMVSLILIKAGLDPTVIIGTKMKEFKNTNFRLGKSKYLVIEADEHFASFLNYWPKIIVLTNIEKEHLDYYKNIRNILKTYKKYIGRLPEDGVLAINGDDANIKKILNSQSLILNKFSIKQKEAGELRKILKLPGEHNIYNALAALTVAGILGVDNKTSLKALSEYRGAWRRFEVEKRKINSKEITIISDYGHHPTEIKATLSAARDKYPNRKIWCVFQPHQHQRTFYLYKEFIDTFKAVEIDNIIITDIYDVAGRETKTINKKISSEKLVEAIKKKNIIYLPIKKIEKYLKDNLKERDVLIIMGAGDIYDKLTKRFY
jgi:UDP-N-acetylmuramate--alanine ligase